MKLAHTRMRTYSTAKPRPLPWDFSQGLPVETRCRRVLPAPLESRLAARSKIRLILTTRHDPSSISLPVSMRSASALAIKDCEPSTELAVSVHTVSCQKERIHFKGFRTSQWRSH